jgi:hypothetical protein
MTDELNPKDRVGQMKPSLSVLSMPVLYEVGNAVGEGSRKYGAFNVRVVPVRASIYFDATMRHLAAWWEGQDIDPDSGIHHVSKAIASLFVLRDAMMHGKVTDDRPPRTDEAWIAKAAEQCAEIIGRHPDPKAPYTEEGSR